MTDRVQIDSSPEGMVEVSKDEFFASVGPRDVMPYHGSPDYTTWETRHRTIVGQTYPGWKNPGGPRAYFLLEGAA